jgi:CopG family transcriptional regulator, nickel-responsive regulator
MDKIERKSIAFDPEQLREFDINITSDGYQSRSEALRNLIRDYLIDKRTKNKNHSAMGTLTFIYDHHAKDIQFELTHLQHHHDVVKSSLHVHVDAKNCMEVLILEGKTKEIETLAKKIIAMKGVEHGKLVLTGPLTKKKENHYHKY